MYTDCFVCGRELRRNTLIAHCPLGSRIAFEPATGRLWVVCHACGRWCLVPLEQRWEAIRECDARFRDAPARVTTGHVGVADLGQLTTLQSDHSGRYFDVHVHRGNETFVLKGTKAVDFLAAVLPRINCDGADEHDVRSATREVDAAESALATRRSERSPQRVWQRIVSRSGDSRPLSHLSGETLLALEMAVLEEQEQRVMADEAASLAPTATSEAEIGKIADELLMPAEISERVERLRTKSQDG